MAADATDEALAQDVIREHRPGLLVLNAGAVPHMAPVHEQTWETFSRNWHVDTRHVFAWTRAALREPLAPGSVVVAMSSGAALGGSPLSGGYASAKAAIRYIRGYAADESKRAGLDIRFVTLLPQLTPAGGVGAVGVAGYAARQGVDRDTFVEGLQPILTPDQVAKAVVDVAGDPAALRSTWSAALGCARSAEPRPTVNLTAPSGKPRCRRTPSSPPWPSRSGRSCWRTATGCSARSTTPRTWCRRPTCERGARSTGSRAAPRCGGGCTRSPPWRA